MSELQIINLRLLAISRGEAAPRRMAGRLGYGRQARITWICNINLLLCLGGDLRYLRHLRYVIQIVAAVT